MAESLLSQPIPYACLWLPRNGGFTLWSHKFWIFAIASYLAYFLLLPCYNLSILTKWSSKNLSLSCSKFTFQKKKKIHFPAPLGKSQGLFHDLKFPTSLNLSSTWKPAPLIIACVFEAHHLPGHFTLDIVLLLIFLYSVCLLNGIQYS